MSKFFKILEIVLLALSACILAYFYYAPTEANTELVLYWAYILFGLAAASAIILPLMDSFSKPKELLKLVGALVLVAVVVVVAYSFSNGDIPNNLVIDTLPTEEVVKYTDTGLIITYLLIGVAACSIIFGGLISKIVNK